VPQGVITELLGLGLLHFLAVKLLLAALGAADMRSARPPLALLVEAPQ
jgi:hypothetical protein